MSEKSSGIASIDMDKAREGITSTEGGGFMCAGRDSVNLYRLLALRQMCRMHLRGLRSRGGSPFTAIKRELGFKGNNEKVLAQLDAYIESLEAA